MSCFKIMGVFPFANANEAIDVDISSVKAGVRILAGASIVTDVLPECFSKGDVRTSQRRQVNGIFLCCMYNYDFTCSCKY